MFINFFINIGLLLILIFKVGCISLFIFLKRGIYFFEVYLYFINLYIICIIYIYNYNYWRRNKIMELIFIFLLLLENNECNVILILLRLEKF